MVVYIYSAKLSNDLTLLDLLHTDRLIIYAVMYCIKFNKKLMNGFVWILIDGVLRYMQIRKISSKALELKKKQQSK